MVAINDATVASTAYDTSGNGGRKLARLSNGWLVSCMDGGTSQLFVEYSTDNGSTWSLLTKINAGYTITDESIVSFGTKVYILFTNNDAGPDVFLLKFDATNVPASLDNTAPFASYFSSVDTTQTAIGNISLAINETGTELSAVWSSKNNAYPSSYNTRYIKGTINADGSISWGAAIQGTNVNATGYDVTNPVVLYANNIPRIIAQYKTTASYYIRQYSISGNTFALDATIIDSGNVSYVQSNPSAAFAPKSINGLTNGRIWVAWQGLDATNTVNPQLRMAYSDDNGATWTVSSTMINNISSPSITVNKINEIFVVYNQNTNNLYWSKINQTNLTTYANNLLKTPSSAPNPSALVDLSLNFTIPLFIYKDTAKVGFYGTWTVISISVTPGNIGEKTDKSNLLTYTITTDGTMSTITESVNGVAIGTKTASSGQSLIAGLTQAQWDAIKYGKYADATGGKNTLTITMGVETWTYTFDKRLATDADVLSAVKAVQDSQNTYLPSIKKQLVDKVGGVTSDSFENIIKNAVMGKKWASGTVNTDSGGTSIERTSSSATYSIGYYGVTVSGLTFTPSIIIVNSSSGATTIYNKDFNYFGVSAANILTAAESGPTASNEVSIADLAAPWYVNNTGFKLPMKTSVLTGTVVNWMAFE